MKSQRFDQLTSQIRGLNVDFYGCLLGDVLINPPGTPITPLKIAPWNLKIPPWKRRNIYKPPIFAVSDSFQECNHVGEKHFSKL